MRINGLIFVIIFFTCSDLDETSCFIRVQMLGVTLPRHQTICAMAEYFPDFSLVFFSFFYWPTSLAWPRTRIWKRPPGFNWSRTTRVSNRTNHKEIESEIRNQGIDKNTESVSSNGRNKQLLVAMPNVEIDEIYNLSSDEKHQRENAGSRLFDFLRVFSF